MINNDIRIIFYIWLAIFVYGGAMLYPLFPSFKTLINSIKSLFSSRNLFGKAQVILLFIILYPSLGGYFIFKFIHDSIRYIAKLGVKKKKEE